jgi:hypothetical protein
MATDDEDNIAFQVESRLMSKGVYVTDVEQDDGYELTYESAAADETGAIPHREVGRVINVFRDLHPEDWAGTEIEATVTDFDGTELGRWRVDEDWFAALQAGDLSETEFSQRVIGTIQSVER